MPKGVWPLNIDMVGSIIILHFLSEENKAEGIGSLLEVTTEILWVLAGRGRAVR